jgi:hypothetical protein
MRRMIEAAELKNQRTVAPEAHMMHLTPDTDPASTFRLRSLTQRRRLDDVQFSSLSPESSLQVSTVCCFLVMRISCQGAGSVCRRAACKGCQKPDPSKSHSTVGMVLTFPTAPLSAEACTV